VESGYTAVMPLDRRCECPQRAVASHVYNSLATIIITRADGNKTQTKDI
jgi:hypothetical protein